MTEVVAVVDYGMGNLHSVSKALEHVAPSNLRVLVTSDPEQIAKADRIVLPGVGAIRDCVHELKDKGLEACIRQAAQAKPFLGICVGMQMLLEHSEENGGVGGLGLFAGNVRRFPSDMKDDKGWKLKVPHMGWNAVHWQAEHPLVNGIESGSRLYFVHSYFVTADDQSAVLGKARHGVEVDAMLVKGNIAAVQFHPEKSSTLGLTLLGNFLRWTPDA